MARFPVMARPSKKQLAEKKAEKKLARRAQSLDRFFEQMCRDQAEDEFLVRCEGCGQEQLAKNPACVVCSGYIAAFVSTIESLGDVVSFPYEPGALPGRSL